jgi:hypothetical protein
MVAVGARHGIRRRHHALSRLSRGSSRASEVWEKAENGPTITRAGSLSLNVALTVRSKRGRVLFRLITYELEPSSLDAPLLMPGFIGSIAQPDEKRGWLNNAALLH